MGFIFSCYVLSDCNDVFYLVNAYPSFKTASVKSLNILSTHIKFIIPSTVFLWHILQTYISVLMLHDNYVSITLWSIHSSRIKLNITFLCIFLHFPHTSPLKNLKLMAHDIAFSYIPSSTCDRVSQSKTQPSSVSLWDPVCWLSWNKWWDQKRNISVWFFNIYTWT